LKEYKFENITLIITNVADSEVSTPLTPKVSNGHDPERVPYTSHPHNLCF